MFLIIREHARGQYHAQTDEERQRRQHFVTFNFVATGSSVESRGTHARLVIDGSGKVEQYATLGESCSSNHVNPALK